LIAVPSAFPVLEKILATLKLKSFEGSASFHKWNFQTLSKLIFFLGRGVCANIVALRQKCRIKIAVNEGLNFFM
jgi:hypothetical protein